LVIGFPAVLFVFFFGLTPVSHGDEIRPASPVNIFGKIIGVSEVFKKVGSGKKIIVEKGK